MREAASRKWKHGARLRGALARLEHSATQQEHPQHKEGCERYPTWASLRFKDGRIFSLWVCVGDYGPGSVLRRRTWRHCSDGAIVWPISVCAWLDGNFNPLAYAGARMELRPWRQHRRRLWGLSAFEGGSTRRETLEKQSGF
jgi:hypothetical protein